MYHCLSIGSSSLTPAENKANLAELLSHQIPIEAKGTLQSEELSTAGGFAVATTAETSRGSDVSLLESSQEEADTRIVLHAKSACQAGFGRLVISCRHRCVGGLG